MVAHKAREMMRVRFFLFAFIVGTLVACGNCTLWEVYREGMSIPTRTRSIDVVKEFHAVGDGETLNTDMITAAITEASIWNNKHNNAGVEIIFPDDDATGSTFLTAPFNLTSHLTLTVAANATLLATNEPDLWPIVAPLPSYGVGRDHMGPRYSPFIGGYKLCDVAILGPGTIDGNGGHWWARHKAGIENFTRGRLIEFIYRWYSLMRSIYKILLFGRFIPSTAAM